MNLPATILNRGTRSRGSAEGSLGELAVSPPGCWKVQVKCCASQNALNSREELMRKIVPHSIAVSIAGEVNIHPSRVGTCKSPSASGRIVAVAATALLAMLVACESKPPQSTETKPEVKTPELITGRAAFQKVFIAARNYAVDVKPFRIESILDRK